MDIEYDATAEGLIQRFRNNDVSNDHWTIDHETWGSLAGFTPSQGRDVVRAALQNTSIRILEVWVFAQMMTDGALDILSIVLGKLRHLNRCNVYQDVDDPPLALVALEKLYGAIAKCPSEIKHLDIHGPCVTPRGLLSLAESFPNLDNLEVLGPRHSTPNNCAACALADELELTFAATVATKLPLLRRVELSATAPHPTTSALLTALHTSSSVREVHVHVPHGDVTLLGAARSFCSCAKSIESFVIHGEKHPDEEVGQEGQGETPRMTDLTTFFDIGPIPCFSKAVTGIEFLNCDFRPADAEGLVKKAVKALQNVEFLRFGGCRFPSAMKVVEGLPHLTAFSCLSSEVWTPYQLMAERPYTLVENQDLEDLCLAVERPGSLLNDVELDLVSTNGESFPAISRLMGACRGQLVINVAHHSWTVASHLVEGAHRLRHDLKDLRLRFLNCRLEDVNYADIVHALAPSKLAHLELGFDPNDTREATELSSAAIQGLIESNDALQTLSLRELRPNGAMEILERIMPVLATKNRTLRTLELHGAVGLTETLPCARARALALDVLKDNFVLSNLVGFDIPEGGPLDNLLLQNRYGRIFLKANDPNPIGIWATVLARVSHDQQIGVMYKFLRAKPALVRRRRTLPAPAAPTDSSSYGDGVVVGQKRRRSATE